MAKEEALAEIRAKKVAARKQDSEEANALINLLQGPTGAQAREATTASSTLDVIMAVQEDFEKEIAALKRNPCSTRPRAPTPPAPHAHQL